MSDPIPPVFTFLHDLRWCDIPAPVQRQVKLSLLDTLGVGASGLQTRLSGIIRAHAGACFGGSLPMLFDGGRVSPPGFALAAGMTIDAMDAHDGYNPSKGHIGAPLIAGALALAGPNETDGTGFLTALVAGYEIGARAATQQHATTPDYHTSGSWGAVTVAAVGARLRALSLQHTREAVGIAEYHGPRSQMMRCIDHPTMVKDGAGWGAMAGVSATLMAEAGFTGAPALILEATPQGWQDLGSRWCMMEQYYKPYPVCRWAQAPIEGVLSLARTHDIHADQVERIEVTTFHESVRLATKTPRTTEEAQYSTSFPCAVALVRGDVTPADIADEALGDPEILRLSQGMVMHESDHANAAFPNRRFAKVTLLLRNGHQISSDYMEPRWDPTAPPSAEDLQHKFHRLAGPVLGEARAAAIAKAVETLDQDDLSPLWELITQPIS
jgi:2-methylcitrate dehydratase PrpD